MRSVGRPVCSVADSHRDLLIFCMIYCGSLRISLLERGKNSSDFHGGYNLVPPLSSFYLGIQDPLYPSH